MIWNPSGFNFYDQRDLEQVMSYAQTLKRQIATDKELAEQSLEYFIEHVLEDDLSKDQDFIDAAKKKEELTIAMEQLDFIP